VIESLLIGTPALRVKIREPLVGTQADIPAPLYPVAALLRPVTVEEVVRVHEELKASWKMYVVVDEPVVLVLAEPVVVLAFAVVVVVVVAFAVVVVVVVAFAVVVVVAFAVVVVVAFAVVVIAAAVVVEVRVGK